MPTVAEYDSATPLLVVKVGRYPVHHGGLGAIRTVGRVGIRAFAMTEDRLTPAALSRYLTGRTVAPVSGLEPVGQLVDSIHRAMECVGRPLVALPTDDEAAVLIAEHRADFGPMLIAPPVVPSLPRKLANKSALIELCARDGVHTARTTILRSLHELDEVAQTAQFPLVAKVVEPFRRLEVPALRAATLIESGQDLRRQFTQWPGPSYVILQEYLPAETSQDWVFHGYFDARSECLVAFTAVKHRSWPPQFGMTTFATTVPNEALAAEAIAFCRRVRYCGIVDMDWRLDQRDGPYRLLD
jgi:D-aspartate ligase